MKQNFSLALALATLASPNFDIKKIYRMSIMRDGQETTVVIDTSEDSMTTKDGSFEIDAAYAVGNLVIFQAQKGIEKLFKNDEDKANLFSMLQIALQRSKNGKSSLRTVGIADTSYETNVYILALTSEGVTFIKLEDYQALEIKGGKMFMLTKKGELDTFSVKDFENAFTPDDDARYQVIFKQQMLEAGFGPFKSIQLNSADEVKKFAVKYEEDVAVIQALGSEGLLGTLDDNGNFTKMMQAGDTIKVGRSDGSLKNIELLRIDNDVAVAA